MAPPMVEAMLAQLGGNQIFAMAFKGCTYSTRDDDQRPPRQKARSDSGSRGQSGGARVPAWSPAVWRARVLGRTHNHVHLARWTPWPMQDGGGVRERNAKPEPRARFKRIETDAEFRARLAAAPIDIHPPSYVTGENLDDYAWNNARKQRKIVEDEA